MKNPARTTIETKYGTLLVTCTNRRHLSIATEPSTEGVCDSIVLSRVRYTLRLSLVAADCEELNLTNPGAKQYPASVPSLDDTDWRITREDFWYVLTRKDWTNYHNSGPTDAARRELVERLLPQIADWLRTDSASRLVSEGEASDLSEVARVARTKAETCRAAAAELDRTAALAEQGADLPRGLRHAVVYGYRLEETWEPSFATKNDRQ